MMHVGNSCCCGFQGLVAVRSQALVCFTCCVPNRDDVKNSQRMKTFYGDFYTIIVLELSSSDTLFILISLPAAGFVVSLGSRVLL